MSNKKRKYSIRVKMMGINISIALISFLLCGGLFVFSLCFLIGKYIDSDMDFFMTEISDNLSEQFEYMEESISVTRESAVLMEFLESEYENQMKKEVQDEFSHLMDINNLDNQRSDWKPIIEEIYLFNKYGEYAADYYYMLVSKEIDEGYQSANSVWKHFFKDRKADQGFVPYVETTGDSIYIACPVMNDRMNMCGTLIFHLNQNALHTIMDELNNYEGSFWLLYDKNQMVLDGSYANSILERLDFLKTPDQILYTDEINGEEYRLYHKELGINLNAVVGIPSNHVFRILYDTIDLYIILICVILLAGILSFAMFTYKITKPLEEFTAKLNSVQNGNFQTKMPEYKEKEFNDISNGFNCMTAEIDHLVNEVYEKQILFKELELKFLQSQLNPHFIFNVLNAISLQAKIDGNGQLSQTISNFSKLIQAKIYRGDLEKIKIREELEYAVYYLEIQKFRFGDRLSYSIEIDESLMDYYIQKLTIQMLVENAVVHGLEPKIGKGTVYIHGYKENGDIVIEIEDDGVGFDCSGSVELPLKNTSSSKDHNQVGINIIHSILQACYGKEYGLSILTKKNKGTTVKIRIPFDLKTENEQISINSRGR